MIKTRRSYLRFNNRPNTGAVAEPAPTYSTQIICDTAASMIQVADDDLVAEAFRIVCRRLARGAVLDAPSVTRDYLVLRLAGLQHEVFTCLFLDAHYRVIACEDLFRGTLTAAQVHPREVVKRALAHNAASIILAHNHPSGIAEPSQADELITRRLKDTLVLVDVRVIDHLIVGGTQVYSFAEHGLL